MTDQLGWSETQTPAPHAFLQWKGTNACMDVDCDCGGRFHVDGFFANIVQCPRCDRQYEMSYYVARRETSDEDHAVIGHAYWNRNEPDAGASSFRDPGEPT